MTIRDDQLIGASVIGSDGRVVGAVEAVFHDDVDRTPRWVQIKAGKGLQFVPLAGSNITSRGLQVPFDAQKIVNEPSLTVGKHMSPAQEEELCRYFNLDVPAQARRAPGAGDAAAQADTSQESIVLTEERIAVSKEVAESGRVKLHKHVETKPVEQAVQVWHEEYEIERMPITPGSPVSGPIAESDLEMTLHEERPVVQKETVPFEQVRLSAKRVTENKVVRGEVARERVEVETDVIAPAPGTGHVPDDATRRR